MTDVLSPRKSGEYISKNSKNVTVLEDGINKLSQLIVRNLLDGSLKMSGFTQCEVHPKVADDRAVNWIFVVDTLNYCFWSSGTKKWCVTWRGKSYTGYFALCAAINRALDEGYPITDPTYYSKVKLDDLKTIFRGDEDSIIIPLLEERQKCLHEVGTVLLEKFGGSFVNCVKDCCNSAEKLLDIISKNFSCFKDECVYNSVKVSFYKRAQILIGDLWTCFLGKGLGAFSDIDKLTMFADYRVPQVLLHFQALKYSDSLLELLKNDVILKYGSEEEIEIRGSSIYVVEQIVDQIKTLLPNINGKVDDVSESGTIICNSILVDHFLWDYRRAHADELASIPFHKTFSIFY